MSRKVLSITAVLMVLMMLLPSCASATPTIAPAATQAQPTQSPPTQAPPTQAPPTQAPPTKAAPTAEPIQAPTIAPTVTSTNTKAWLKDWLPTIGGEDFLYSPVKGNPTVGILGVSKTHEYQQTRDRAGTDIAKKMDINLILDTFESDVAMQRTKSEDFVSKGVKCEISTSRDDDSWIALGNYLNQNNVLFYGEGGTADKLTREMNPSYIGYVGVDNYQNAYDGGVWAANYFNKTYPDKTPKLAVGNYPSSVVAVDRANGFIDGFKSVDPNLEVVINDGMGSGAGRADVLPYIENWFTAKDFNIFFGIWDEPAMAAMTAAKARGLTPKDLMIVGYDGTVEVAKVINEPGSLIVGDIGQDPVMAGKLTTAICAKLLDGELKLDQVPVYLYIPGFLVSADTADQFLSIAGQK